MHGRSIQAGNRNAGEVRYFGCMLNINANKLPAAIEIQYYAGSNLH